MAETTVKITVAAQSLAYLNSLLNAGILRGARGKRRINPVVAPLGHP